MPAIDTIAPLTAFDGRGPGSDAERRAALWLRAELSGGGRSARVEPFWCRPGSALAHAWHALLGLAGGLVTVSDPTVGGLMVLAALICVLVDEAIGISPGRRLTPERASQNVVSTRAQAQSEPDDRVRLIVTASYDAGRMGLVYRDRLRRLAARLRRATGGRAPGWLGWLTVALWWLLVIVAARLHGSHGTTIGLLQLPPTIALVLVIALLFELASAPIGPAASDNASGVAVALALARALDVAAPRALRVEVVIAGAGEGGGIGLRRFLGARRGELTSANAIVLGISACGSGSPRWWHSDGPLIPLAYHPRLRELCAGIARSEPDLGVTPHRGRGATPALPARIAGIPAIAVGCLDEHGLHARSHQPGDTAEAVDRASVDATLELALMLVDAIDAELTARRGGSSAAPAGLTPA
ncbi:MAG TPA: M28 family peptidase [Solirubrobacteraceae bacterium]